MNPTLARRMEPFLGNNEKIVWVTNEHYVQVLPELVFFAWLTLWLGAGLVWFGETIEWLVKVITITWLLLFVYYVIWERIDWGHRILCITERRVLIRQGWLNRQVPDISIRQVTGTHVRQTWWMRAINCGDVVLKLAAEKDMHFRLLPKPFEVRSLIEKTRGNTWSKGSPMPLEQEAPGLLS